MAYTLEQYTLLKEAIANGSESVKYGDKEVKYRSLSDMMRVLSLMEAELFPNSPNLNRRKLVEQGRGF